MFTIASFEFRARLRLMSTWVYFLVFFALSMALSAAAGGLFKGANVSFGSDKVFINSPYALGGSMCVLAMFGIVVIAAVMGRAVQQDFEYRMQSFFFTAPIDKLAYLGGRFLGDFGVCVVILASVGLGSWIATYLPGMDATRVGPNRLLAYLLPYVFIIIPNIFLIGGVFFSVAALSRKMLPVYVGSVLLLLGWLLSANLLGDMENKTLAAFVDPFGLQAQSVLTDYWTVSERNSRLLVLEGVLLWNRLLWLAIGASIVGVCCWRFSFAQAAAERVGKATKKKAKDEFFVPAALPGPVVLKLVPGQLLRSLTRLYLNNVVRDVYFGVLVLAGVLFLFVSSKTLGDVYGTNTWPVTSQVLMLVSTSFSFFMLVIITFYSGELVWREREVNIAQIVDATPVHTWVPFVAKLLALMAIPVLLQFVMMLAGIVLQLSQGYTHLELGLWVHDLFGIKLITYWLLCALALTVQSAVNQKYLGHFVMIVYYIVMLFSGPMGFEDYLYKYGRIPGLPYSDMNGFGEALYRTRVFQAYWSAAAVVLLAGGYLFWVRGTISGWRERMAVARQRLTLPVLGLGGLALIAFCALGGFIFYNTHVLNAYESSYSNEQLLADYEKTYKATAVEPQPKVTAIAVAVDLFPKEQRVRSHGTYTLENKTATPISVVTLGVDVRSDIVVHELAFDTPSQLMVDDRRLGVRRFKLAQPLAPGAHASLRFDLESVTHGFRNDRMNTSVVGNGSFVQGSSIMPVIGYQEGVELQRDRDRRKFGLAPKETMRKQDDPVGLARNYVTGDGDWIDFSAQVSTDADQIAIAPGYLQSDVTKDGRRTFAYKMDVPILDFVSFLSARYTVKHDVWHDPINHRDVALEIYYHAGHEFDLASMFSASKAALAYCSENFSPYQHQQLRIVEFPSYATFAQSFPNTVPFSEGIGFIARVRPNDEKDIDYPYYVTAHEVAHQWWAHQVIGGNVEGTTVLSETLAQYSALMVMKQKFGEAKMRRFLSYELDRYLTGRSTEQKKELPLAFVDSDQGYIHYRKGSLVMYALQDYIGEAKVNEALKSFLAEHAYQGPPYPTSQMLVEAFRKVTPPDLQYLLNDMFERIVVYDNRAISAEGKALANGSFDVTVTVKVRKTVADGEGKETEVKPDDLIEIGVMDTSGKPMVLKKERITTDTATFTLNVPQKPGKAGIDPLNELIDRVPSDNTIAVEMK